MQGVCGGPQFNSIILQTSPCLPCQREVAPQRRRDSCLLPIAFLQPPSRGRACPARTLPKASPPILNNNIPRQPPRLHQLPPARNLPRPKNSPRGCFCPAVRWTRGPGFSIPALLYSLPCIIKRKKAQPLAKLSFLVTRAGIEPTLTA